MYTTVLGGLGFTRSLPDAKPGGSGTEPDRRVAAVLGPPEAGCQDAGSPEAGFLEARVIDLSSRFGDTYGALGVLQVAIAASLLAREPTSGLPATVRVVCGDSVDGWRFADVTGAGPQKGDVG